MPRSLIADFVDLGSELACKENGKMSVEGKEYVVAYLYYILGSILKTILLFL